MTLESNNFPIAVIGAQSMVGSRFVEILESDVAIIKADLNGDPKLDITDPKSVADFFKNYDFKSAILFSAFTDVDGAEAQRNDKNGICWKINVEGVKNIVKAAKQKNCKLIFISTDFVFDGQNGPYSEDDAVGTNPDQISWYGLTKIESEKIIQENLENFIILRIAYPYRGKFKGKDDTLKRILKPYKEGRLYPMFNNQQQTITFIDDIPQAVKLLLEKDQKGIFHLSSPRTTTPFAIAKFLISTFGLDPTSVKPGSIVEFLKSGAKTPRPVKGGLKVDKIKSLGFTPTDWDEGIKIVYKQSEGELV